MNAWLESELAAVRGELARVDAKCGVLMAIATGAAAFAATQTGHGPVAARMVLAASGVASAAAVLVLLAALRPRFGPGGWCRYVQMPALGIKDLDRYGHTVLPGPRGRTLRTADLAVEDLSVLSRMTHAKYTRVRCAVYLIGAGVVLLVTGAVAGVIA